MIFTTRSERYEDHIGASSASNTAQASGSIQPKERERAKAADASASTDAAASDLTASDVDPRDKPQS